MLRETAHEMSLIAFEKKQLLQQWKGALIGLARRDEALTAATNALKEAQSAARSVSFLPVVVSVPVCAISVNARAPFLESVLMRG